MGTNSNGMDTGIIFGIEMAILRLLLSVIALAILLVLFTPEEYFIVFEERMNRLIDIIVRW